MKQEFNIVICGGGTGGHLYPGLAIAEQFCADYPGTKVTFVGTARGIESRIIAKTDYPLVLLPVRGIQRRITLRNVLVPFQLGWSILKSVLFLKKLKPDMVIGTGGYVAGPPLLAAKWLGITTVIQEQNSFPGLVNRKIGHNVDAVFITFEDSRRFFTGQKNLWLCGNPVRLKMTDNLKKQALEKYNLKSGRKTLLVFGGSQGAKGINQVVGDSISELVRETDLQIIWIVGPAWEDHWKSAEAAHPKHVRVLGYVENMAQVYALADLAVCRAGAMTISELTLFGIPAIFIPFPFATADHQTKNAESVVAAGAATRIAEQNLRQDALIAEVNSILEMPNRLEEMATAARKLAKPEAAKDIVEKCVGLIRE